MDRSFASLVSAFSRGPLRLCRKQKAPSGNWQNVVACVLCIWAVFLKNPLLVAARSFPGNRLGFEIYTDARAMSNLPTDVIDWESGVVIWGSDRKRKGVRADFPRWD